MELWSQMAIQSCPKWRQVCWPLNTCITERWFTAGWSYSFELDRSLWPKQFPLIVEVIIHRQPQFVAGRVGVSSLKRGLGRTLQYPLQEMCMPEGDKSFREKWSKQEVSCDWNSQRVMEWIVSYIFTLWMLDIIIFFQGETIVFLHNTGKFPAYKLPLIL